MILQYRGYAAAVEFDTTAGVFHGEVSNLHDVITFQGRDEGELRQAFEDSVEDYLAFCEARGEEAERPLPISALDVPATGTS